ncbi:MULTISPECIES: dephospho-CoA kinase [Thalassospira]|uniref:Dephospho-CoA kinase n=1 Tax=Thalassospira profundimaris TaxID=502049 RepID=A0A367VG53_9PROT|nr:MULTISPECIES: dephospho-CoA kinase [Thalassospira]KZB71517.1 dephospho-CoA kinase [Thalassospira sp. MCCC 1A01148]MBR9898749.1 dephospho-CoA kinase [Rhodospirillales bacterium]RCK24165.1 dephospho-CoA kinase [Thalassospira profundimaris]
MKILGLTGSIGMGKSTAAAMFRTLGVPVHDADASIHELMAPDGLGFDPIAAAFPDVITDGRIDRQALGKIAFADPAVLKKLETILHPLVRAAENRFLAKQRRLGRKLVVLDIPLLYETSGEKRCDHVAVVTAPGFVQRQRVLSREGMTDAKFSAILSKQMPDTEKRKRADFIIPTGLGRAVTFQCIQGIIDQLS